MGPAEQLERREGDGVGRRWAAGLRRWPAQEGSEGGKGEARAGLDQDGKQAGFLSQFYYYLFLFSFAILLFLFILFSFSSFT